MLTVDLSGKKALVMGVTNQRSLGFAIAAKLKEQAKGLYGEGTGDSQDLWAQFLKFQGPAMQHMMGAYVEQSQKMFQQMQDTMQEQTRKIFPGIYVKPEEKGENK